MVMDTQIERAKRFKLLHQREGLFVIPNPWDVGSAKMLASLGFEALATTSAGLAFSLGKADHAISRAEVLANASAIVNATVLPVSADLENGFGDKPETCAETILFAAQTGLVGGSIEDATGKDVDPIYPFDLSVERVKAAVKAAKSLDFHFMLTARAENFLCGKPDLADTIRRLEAYAEAGADVLFAPGLTTKEQIEAVVKAVAPKPVNVIMGRSGESLSLDELVSLGVKRISVGSSLARVAYGAFINAAKEIKEHSSFSYAQEAIPFAQINSIFAKD